MLALTGLAGVVVVVGPEDPVVGTGRHTAALGNVVRVYGEERFTAGGYDGLLPQVVLHAAVHEERGGDGLAGVGVGGVGGGDVGHRAPVPGRGLVGLITGVGVRTDGGVEIMVTRHGGPVVAGGHVE